MTIDIVCSGRSLAAHEQAWVEDYVSRAKKYARVNIIRVKEKSQDDAWRAMQKHLSPKSLIVVLDPAGKNTSTEQLRKIFEKAELEKKGSLTLVIGGAYGLHADAYSRANATIAFGSLTLPHRIVLLIAVEQIYRVLSWKAGSPYHHA